MIAASHTAGPFLALFGGAGFFVGNLSWVLITRWAALLYETSRKHGGDFLGAPKRRLVWSLPFVALLHPGFWLLCAIPLVTIRAVRSPSDKLTWLLVGFYFAFVLMAVATIATLARIRRSARGRSTKA